MVERIGVYRVLVVRPERRRQLRRPLRRWEDIRIGLQKVGWGMQWIKLAQGSNRWHALVCVLMNLQTP